MLFRLPPLPPGGLFQVTSPRSGQAYGEGSAPAVATVAFCCLSRHFGRGEYAMNFHFSLVALAALFVTACATDPPEQVPVGSVNPPPATVVEIPAPPTVVNVEKSSPPPKIAKAPGPKTPSKCKGLPQLACINVEGCEWIKPASSTDRDGRLLTEYCGLQAGTAAANQ
jgi:hypothetical protein